jgi:hypothetical protein
VTGTVSAASFTLAGRTINNPNSPSRMIFVLKMSTAGPGAVAGTWMVGYNGIGGLSVLKGLAMLCLWVVSAKVVWVVDR